MAPTQPSHPAATKSSGPRRIKILVFAMVISLLLVTLLGAGVFVYVRWTQPAAETATDIAAASDPVSTIAVNGVAIPAYPAAAQTVPGSNTLVVNGVSVDQVTQWYQTMLPAVGFTVQAVETGRLVSTDPNGQAVELLVQSPADGQVTIDVIAEGVMPAPELIPPVESVEMAVTGNEAMPAPELIPPEPPSEAEVMTQPESPAVPIAEEVVMSSEEMPAGEIPVVDQPATTGTAPVMSAAEEAEEIVGSEAPVAVDAARVAASTLTGVTARVSPASIYGGTLNRLEYTLIVTGSGVITVTATLPAGILVQIDDVAAQGLNYVAAARTLTWRPDLAGLPQATVTFEAVNDLLALPDSLVMKVVAQSGDPNQQPIVQVATLDIEEY